jgi:branched-chain amino acid transport system ATP-binding protein
MQSWGRFRAAGALAACAYAVHSLRYALAYGSQAPAELQSQGHAYLAGAPVLLTALLAVGAGELVCLMGRNGAGKTTTLRAIMGYLRPVSGAIAFNDRSIAGMATHRIAQMGVGYSPEESQVFGDLTVAENIEIGTWTRATARPAAERVAQAYEVFPRLRAYAGRGGAQISGGERKMLSIARALALDAELLLLDEPFEGLSPAIVPTITQSIAAITGLERGVLLAESNIHHVPAFASRLYVIERGEIVFAGSLDEAQRDAAVLRVIGGKAS